MAGARCTSALAAAPWASLFDAAIGHARGGFIVPAGVAHKWPLHVPRLACEPGFAGTFLPQGRAPQAGERFANVPLAHTLERIARQGAREFYEGHTADLMLAHARVHGGAWRSDDLGDYQAQWVQPLAQRVWGDWCVHELPPSGQGIAALQALAMLVARGSELPADPDDPRHAALAHRGHEAGPCRPVPACGRPRAPAPGARAVARARLCARPRGADRPRCTRSTRSLAWAGLARCTCARRIGTGAWSR